MSDTPAVTASGPAPVAALPAERGPHTLLILLALALIAALAVPFLPAGYFELAHRWRWSATGSRPTPAARRCSAARPRPAGRSISCSKASSPAAAMAPRWG